MDPTPLANAAFNDQVVGQLISSGHVWVGVGILLFQLAVIPVINKFIRQYSEKTKVLIDAERKITAMQRDAQMNAFSNRLDKVEDKHNNDYSVLSDQMQGLKKAIDKFEVKLDKVLDKLYDNK